MWCFLQILPFLILFVVVTDKIVYNDFQGTTLKTVGRYNRSYFVVYGHVGSFSFAAFFRYVAINGLTVLINHLFANSDKIFLREIYFIVSLLFLCLRFLICESRFSAILVFLLSFCFNMCTLGDSIFDDRIGEIYGLFSSNL